MHPMCVVLLFVCLLQVVLLWILLFTGIFIAVLRMYPEADLAAVVPALENLARLVYAAVRSYIDTLVAEGVRA